MASYLVKRFGQTLLFILFAALFMFTMLVYFMPGGPAREYSDTQSSIKMMEAAANPITTTNGSDLQPVDVQQLKSLRSNAKDLEQRYKLDRPWPVSFLAWLYDPTDTTQLDGDLQEIPKGIDITIGGFTSKGRAC